MATNRARAFWIALAGLALTAGTTGCVERRYTIRSDPPGALVVVNGEEVGVTPVSKAYTYYGNRRVRLVRQGYETLDLEQKFDAPWYDNYLTEFFTENLIPYTFRDERTLTYKMKPETPADPVELRQRGDLLRQDAKTLPPPRRGGILGFFGFD